MTRYLSVADVLAIHEDLIERYGGSRGLRDVTLLEAAVNRPRSGYYTDVFSQAAALWESLSQNHPFIDGNKRVGFAVAYTFLFVNGYLITADAEASFAFIDGLYSGRSFARVSLEGWLRDNTEARPDSM